MDDAAHETCPGTSSDGLTEPQRAAVEHLDGPLLVLAGPGSGKTRVITRRVANLVANGIPAWSILALTFTNKAAGEMRDRIDTLVPPDVPGRKGLTVTTFHSLCARLLRRYAVDAGVSETYSIYDSSDQRSAVKQALKRAGMDSKNWTPAGVLSHISNAKNQLLDAHEYARQATDFYTRSIAKAYTAYDDILKKADALDFDDLLMKVATLLRENEPVRTELQDRYQYLLIDEYQDTNHVQFVIAHTLAAEHRNICVVGDPDQSIYGWRGADIRNILDFETHYGDATTIPLGQNFRSTGHIVATADGLIQHNTQRKHKDLFTDAADGEQPKVVRAVDEHHEASLVADELQRQHEEGFAWKDMAVMYRVNALSRVMEEVLRTGGIPHVIARGTAFYDRAEIKDALGYLRVLANGADEISLRRIINTPTRGIGKTTIERLELFAYSNNCSLLDAVMRADEVSDLTDRARKAVGQFGAMVSRWRSRLHGQAEGDLLRTEAIGELAELVEMVIQESGLENLYRRSKTEEDTERLLNLEELVSSAADYAPPMELGPAPEVMPTLFAWLESIVLVSDADMIDPENGAVTLMTLHAAKGLEFPVVCMIGLEEGMLPHFNSVGSDAGLEEERRLCYVGITRAMQSLMISSAAKRTHRGLRERTMISQFVRELPEAHIEAVDVSSGGWSDSESGEAAVSTYGGHSAEPEFMDLHVGSMVRHPQFGVGRVESLERARDHTRSRIAFGAVGSKTLILEYARLEVMES